MGKDIISCLPDDLVVGILCFLHLKEAGRTSVLSRRWRYVWTYLSDLDFEDSEKLYLVEVDYKPPSPRIKVDNYVNWVNQVLAANRALHISSFKVHFVLNQIFSADIHKWLDFAMNRKRVGNLELNFGTLSGSRVCDTYSLDSFFHNRYKYNNDNLQSLSLVAVDISVNVLDHILASCPNLERLSLSKCSDLVHLKFAVSSCKLKHLRIIYCHSIEGVDLFAPNLTSFAFGGWSLSSVEYRHVPNLVEAAFGGTYCDNLMYKLHSLSSFYSQLHKLSLDLRNQVCYTSGVLGAAFGNLKQLELVVLTNINFLCLTSFFEACPLLHTFKLKVFPWARTEKPVAAKETHGDDGVKHAHAHTHKNLKVIEYVGFDGSPSCVELALCLTQLSPLLEKCIFDCRIPVVIGEPRTRYGDWYTEKVRLFTEAAQDLADKIRLIKPVQIVIM